MNSILITFNKVQSVYENYIRGQRSIQFARLMVSGTVTMARLVVFSASRIAFRHYDWLKFTHPGLNFLINHCGLNEKKDDLEKN